MIFVCPRALCRPYFELIELWTNKHCVPASWSHVVASERWGWAAAVSLSPEGRTTLPAGNIFADARSGSPNGQHGPPDVPYWLPPLPSRIDSHWYFYARYNDGRPCTTRPHGSTVEPTRCCGLVAELLWPYAIARQCKFDHDLHQRPGISGCPHNRAGGHKLECVRLLQTPPEYLAWVQVCYHTPHPHKLASKPSPSCGCPQRTCLTRTTYGT